MKSNAKHVTDEVCNYLKLSQLMKSIHKETKVHASLTKHQKRKKVIRIVSFKGDKCRAISMALE